MNLLIVEDDKSTVDLLRNSFEDEGFTVDVAMDGAAGSYKARINSYDLIILDINLPEKDGRQVCTEIRQNGKVMPILILSVKSEIESKASLLDMGADDYVIKPYSFIELLARVKALLRRPKHIEYSIFKIEGLVLDVDCHTVKRDGKLIKLTPKEFMLLEYLMRNRGRVLTRTHILEHVWGDDADPFSNTIETHILNLRRKIDQNKKKKLIHTIPSMGYKIS
jgi:DNA-binding response OmpR family regulator